MTSNINHLISPDEQAAIRQPIEKALTLPRQAFTSREIYNLEIERIYSRHWVATIYSQEIPGSGDVKPFEICGIPLVAVRDNGNTLRVFHNICPYDGCPIAFEPARGVKQLKGAYHGWTFGLDGSLLSMPYWNGYADCGPDALNEKEGDLAEVRSAIWQGIVFVNISGNAEPFGDYIKPVSGLLAEYDLDLLEIARGADGEPNICEGMITTNWKTYCENACINILHEGFTHRMYRESSDVPRVDEKGNKRFRPITDGALVGFEYDDAALTDTYPEFPFPPLGRDRQQPPVKGYFLTLYPNLYLAVMPSIIEIGVALPDGPDKTVDWRGYYCHKDAARDPKMVHGLDSVADLYIEAGEEDNTVTEAVQKARRSPVFTQHYFSPFWDEPHYHFTQLVLDDLTRND